MRDRLDEFDADTRVALVTFTDPESVDRYSDDHALPFPILLAPDRDAYRAYGLDRGSWTRVWGWKAARRYVDIIRSDGLSGLRRPTEDILQLGGDFVIAPDGTLAWGRWGEGPDDRPTIDELITAVHHHSS